MEKISHICSMRKTKIGIIIPDRGDRPKFLANCLRMIKAQTVKADIIELVNDPPISEDRDITWRYRIGYDRLRDKGLDFILLMENDDFYHPKYIEMMRDHWLHFQKPDILGTDYTIYYHVKLFKHFTMNHKRRASAMNTLIKPDLDFPWCVDREPYTDLHLWKTIQGKIFHPPEILSIGIKHGEGLTGGRNHVDQFHRFISDDGSQDLLRKNMDSESFKFYTTYYEQPQN